MNLRTQMPETAAFVDALRETFGAEGINEHIRAGLRGERNRFHARENGLEVGVAFDAGESYERDSEGIIRKVQR